MADFDDWDKNDAGLLKVWPLDAFETALFGSERGGIRLEIGGLTPKSGEPVPALQLALTLDQLRGLASALEDVADRLEAARKSGGTSQ